MKIVCYKPLTQLQEPQGIPAIPIAVLTDVIFRSTSLEDALEELRREGCRDSTGRTLLPGTRDLLEHIKDIRAALSAGGDGPVTSGASSHKEAVDGSARSQPVASEEMLSPTPSYSHKLQVLEQSIKRVYWGFDPESVDDQLLEELLGKRSLREWYLVKNLNKLVFHSGLAERGPAGFELTATGLQKIAWNILKETFKYRKPATPPRRLHPSLSVEPYLTEGTRPYRFGDPPLIDTGRSLLNAITRAGIHLPVQLKETDFAVYQKEVTSKSATVILLDLSKSMRFENRYIAAKKVTLALHGLIRKRYPRDRIAVVGFSTRACTVRTGELPFLTWDDKNPYTNMEEALDLAQRILARQKGYRRQVFLITDGEPTAHHEKASLFFQFPPHPKTLARTLAGLKNLSRHHIETCIFLLSREREQMRFAHLMAQRCGGRLFQIDPEDLGRCLLMDYLQKKSRWV